MPAGESGAGQLLKRIRESPSPGIALTGFLVHPAQGRGRAHHALHLQETHFSKTANRYAVAVALHRINRLAGNFR